MLAECYAFFRYRDMIFAKYGKYYNNSIHDFSRTPYYIDMVMAEQEKLNALKAKPE
jgi:hypothetical protein